MAFKGPTIIKYPTDDSSFMTAPKFGFMIPNSGPVATPVAIRRVAQTIQDLELNSAWVHDHISYGRDWLGHRASGLAEQISETTEPDFYESINTLSFIAGFTDAVQLGIAIVVLPLRNPLVLARQLLTLQVLSGGRLILGVGAGDYPSEFEAVQVPYRERGPIADEYLDALRKLLHGTADSYKGKYVNIKSAQLYPKAKPPPILVGGGAVAVPEPEDDKLALGPLTRAARYGDGWLPDWGKPDLIQRGTEIIRELSRKYNREDVPFPTYFYTALHLASTDQEAVRRTARSVEFSELEANKVARYGRRTPLKTLERSLIGSTQTIIRRIESYAEAGVVHFVLTPLTNDLDSTLRMMDSFAKEVLPSFQ